MGNGDVGRDELARARILSAAVKVMARDGYRGTTVPAIVEAAEVDDGDFREYFPGKEECFLAVFDQMVDTAEKLVAERVTGQRSWADRTAAAIEACLEAAAADPARAHLCLSEVHVVGGPAVARYASLVSRVSAQLRPGRDLQPSKHAAPDDLELFLVSGFVWILQRQLEEQRDGWVSKLLPELQRFVLGAFIEDFQTASIGHAPPLLAPLPE